MHRADSINDTSGCACGIKVFQESLLLTNLHIWSYSTVCRSMPREQQRFCVTVVRKCRRRWFQRCKVSLLRPQPFLTSVGWCALRACSPQPWGMAQGIPKGSSFSTFFCRQFRHFGQPTDAAVMILPRTRLSARSTHATGAELPWQIGSRRRSTTGQIHTDP